MTTCLTLGALALLIWLGITLHPARPWDFRPVGEDTIPIPDPSRWPSVHVLIPARNESTSLPKTLPSVLEQDYPGAFSVTVIDDRSEDETAATAVAIAEKIDAHDRLHVVAGKPLPSGWVGKMWALQQGVVSYRLRAGGPPAESDYVLLTDADIWHAPRNLRRLVAESEARQLALNSRMACLRCDSPAERLLIPAFVFFFILLYPMRWINNPDKSTAAAAGGCVLLSKQGLGRIGGFQALRSQIIDDVNLGKLVQQAGLQIYLALSGRDVKSLRAYDDVSSVWRMVRRTAFTELNYSWLRLCGTLVGMLVMFGLPPVFFLAGLVLCIGTLSASVDGGMTSALFLMVQGGISWGLMSRVYWPGVRFFGLSGTWAISFPLAGLLYEAMTLDSALRHARKQRIDWR